MKRFAQLFDLGEYQMLVRLSTTPVPCKCGKPTCKGITVQQSTTVETMLAENLACVQCILPGASLERKVAVVLAIDEAACRKFLVEFQYASANLKSMQQAVEGIQDILREVHDSLTHTSFE